MDWLFPDPQMDLHMTVQEILGALSQMEISGMTRPLCMLGHPRAPSLRAKQQGWQGSPGEGTQTSHAGAPLTQQAAFG